MPLEIEKKFLLANGSWRNEVSRSQSISQGYLSREPACTVRVRVSGEQAWLTVKGPSMGASRLEYEYAVPPEDARRMLSELANRPLVEKTRHYIPMGELTWEIDEFHGDNEGLLVAELELPAEDAPFDHPAWLGREVTGIKRYYNSHLVHAPYSTWPQEEK